MLEQLVLPYFGRHSDDQFVHVVIGTFFESIFIFSCLYGFLSLIPSKLYGGMLTEKGVNKSDVMVSWNSRIISLINAIFCVYGAFQMILFSSEARQAIFSPEIAVFSSAYPAADPGPPGSETDSGRAFYFAVFAGYLAHDLLLCLTNSCIRDMPTLLHHFVVLVALMCCLKFDGCTLYIGLLLFNEASTPFLNLRYFLYKAGLEASAAYLCNGVCLFLSFLVFRIGLVTSVMVHIGYAWWEVGLIQGHIYSEPSYLVAVAVFLTILASLHWAINIYWFSIISIKISEALTSNDKNRIGDENQETKEKVC